MGHPEPRNPVIDKNNQSSYNAPTALLHYGAREEGSKIEEEAEMREWLTVPEVAELRKISRQSVRDAILNGRLKADPFFETKAGRIFYRVRRDVALAWEEEIARRGKGRPKKEKPKTEKPGRNRLALAHP